MADNRLTIAILGGTGAVGAGLAWRWAKAGYPVIIGSRAAEKAEQAVREVVERAPGAALSGSENLAAAAAADIVVLTVPYANHGAMLEAVKDTVQGKIFVDVTVPLVPPKVSRVQLPDGGSVAKAAQEYLGPDVKVVSALQNVAAAHLSDNHGGPDCDVLVCGDDADARQQVVELIEAAGLKGWHAGPIDNSAVAEALTSVLIFINRRYKIDGAGIRITGQPQE
jgi:NADPH-dependent F420 reductase